jgi:hypothetical protein
MHADTARYRVLDLREVSRDERDRVAAQRRVAARREVVEIGEAGPLERLLASLPRNRLHVIQRRGGSLPAGLICVFVCRFVSADGDVLEQSVVGLGAPLPLPLLAALPSPLSVALSARARAVVEPRLTEVAAFHQRTLLVALQRERQLASHDRAAPLPLVQPGMFDRRALKERERAARLAAARQDERTCVDPRGTTAMAVRLAEPELVLVLVVPPAAG